MSHQYQPGERERGINVYNVEINLTKRVYIGIKNKHFFSYNIYIRVLKKKKKNTYNLNFIEPKNLQNFFIKKRKKKKKN